MKRKLIVFIVGALAGCSVPTAEQSSVKFTSSAGTQFLATHVPVKVSLTQLNETESTSSQYGLNNTKEVAGKCTIKEARYSVAFNVPGTVNLPAYSSGVQPIDITCTYSDGEVQRRIEPENLSRKARQNTNIGLVLLCPLCGLGSVAAGAGKEANRANDIFGFHEIKISLD
ncbi:MAG: hypothetical protein ABJ360_05610 [Roseobacter sp.]